MCRNMNLDDTFAYDTPKVVRVRDKYLGIFRYIFLTAIFFYIVVKVVVLDKAYNIHDSPSGISRVSLLAPSKTDSSVELFCPTHPDYPKSWPYPGEIALKGPPSLQGLPIACQMWDEHSVTLNDELNAIFISTRVAIEDQAYNCGQENTNQEPKLEPTCDTPWTTIPATQSVFFLAGISNYTLGIQHNYFAQNKDFLEYHDSKDYFRGNSRDRDGKIIYPDGTSNRFPKGNSTSDVPDIITVGNFLKAGGVSLADSSKDPLESLMYSGAVLVALVKYTNNYGWQHPSAGDITYEYEVIRVKNSDYKFFQQTPLTKLGPDGQATRRITKRAGPKLIFIVTGDFVQWSGQNLLLQGAAAVGLLGISTVIVELIMLYLMKYRRHYKAAKFEETDDFTSLYQGSDDAGTTNGDAPPGDDQELLAEADWGSTVGSGGQYSKFRS